MLYNIGLFRRLTRDMDIRVEGYYTATDNYITSESHTYPKVRYADNIDKVWTKGAELEFNRSAKVGPGIHFNYNFYLIDWFDDSLDIDPFLMKLTPKHRLNVGFTYSLLRMTSLSLDSRIALGRSSKTGLTMDDYSIFNSGIEQGLFNQKLKINLRVENILNTNYQEILGYPMPGRSFTATLHYLWP
jgi:outer membrane cobalamin receptor